MFHKKRLIPILLLMVVFVATFVFGYFYFRSANVSPNKYVKTKSENEIEEGVNAENDLAPTKKREDLIKSADLKKFKQEVDKGILSTGVNIDCARRFCSLGELKKYVDLVAEDRNPFLHVHFTDNESVGIECFLFDQIAEQEHRNEDGTYTNPKTKKRFLSRADALTLQQYAKEKGVNFVPEIDLPAHAGGFFRLAELKHGKQYLRSVAANIGEGEIDISQKEGLDFAKNIYAEYAELFKDSQYFHMGCDELFSASEDDKLAYIKEMSNFLQEQGFVVEIWNDFITKKNVKEIPSKIKVTYWSFDGDTEDGGERARRRHVRASLPDLQDNGFSVLNYNSYYLYFVPSRESCNQYDMNYMLNDIKRRWDLRKWDGEYGARAKSPDGIVGAAISVWKEDSRGVTADTIYNYTSQFYRAMADKVELNKAK